MKDALILAPFGRDASVAAGILDGKGFSSEICACIDDCVDRFEQAFCFIVTEEALLAEERGRLSEWVKTQPKWSDFPLVLLTTRGNPIDERLAFLSEYGVSLERPFGPLALVAAVRSAVRARKRQLEVRAFLDERERTNARQRLLIRELHHRVKNTLANVQAVLGATARSSTSIDELYKSFSARVQSLARTHSFLTDDYWQTASLEDLLKAELAHYDDRGRVRLDGPKVSLNADQAVPLGMAFHELATNSSKYGALSGSAGVLEVEWSTTSDGENERLSFVWKERGGPPVVAPTRKGFGSILFERVLAVQLEAEINMNFLPAGLEIALSLPLKRDRLVPEYQGAP
ncbi:sensor histidine kinase [Corticibacterium sp. UT-5YL-CI-8]|nr:sensor histidine kinase [Tianweitania sp. UT-5YL-CI-8]